MLDGVYYQIHTILKVTFLSKSSILTKPQHFHEFFTQNFVDNFSREIKSCQQLKSLKPQHFHEFFTKKIDNFLGKSKLNFWTKNEDFEQCAVPILLSTLQLCLTLGREKSPQKTWPQKWLGKNSKVKQPQ